jgi:hypothetical protein
MKSKLTAKIDILPISLAFVILLVIGGPYIMNKNNSFAEVTTTIIHAAGTSTNTIGTIDTSKTFSTFHLSGIIGSTIAISNNNESNSMIPLSNNSSSGIAMSNRQPNTINYSSLQSIFNNNSQILAGRWAMDVTNGNIEYFVVDFIMGSRDGTDMHVHSIQNLRGVVLVPSKMNTTATFPGNLSSKLELTRSNNYTFSLYGSADIFTNDKIQWRNVPTIIYLFHGNVISIFPYPSYTNNHFHGSSIFGVVTLMTDAHYNLIRPSLWAP